MRLLDASCSALLIFHMSAPSGVSREWETCAVHALVLCGGGSVSLLPPLKQAARARGGAFATTLSYNKESTFNPGKGKIILTKGVLLFLVVGSLHTPSLRCRAVLFESCAGAAFVVAGRLKRREKWWGGHFVQPPPAAPAGERARAKGLSASSAQRLVGTGAGDEASDRARDRALGGLLAALLALFVALKTGLV